MSLPVVDPAELWLEGQPEYERAAPELPEPPEALPAPVPLEPPRMHPDFTAGCGHAAVEGAKFCPECGQPVAEPEPRDWVCGQQHQCAAAYRFCPQCGDVRPDVRAPVAGAGALVEMLARPKPYALLTPAERAERDRMHREAVQLGARDPGVQYVPPPAGDTELIHFLEDGLTFAGQVWFRGQELELEVGSERWVEAQAWINMTDFEQAQRFNGKVFFRKGPWPGLRYQDALQGQEAPPGAPDVSALMQAEMKERQRGRRVPARVR